MSEYKPTIGLEIHAELATQTKMFCDSKNDPDLPTGQAGEREPNRNICPVCMGHPGTLPVINKAAVAHVLRVGAACDSTLADYTEFDRKNYFYPDLPKGYQISQYKHPLVSGGVLDGVALTRIHLEEDAARNVHDEGIAGKDYSLIDYNRAGLPLMELVTEPVIKSAAQAAHFAKELQLLLRYLGASDANMDKGQMRVEANISVSTTEKFGTKVEVKNINSFRSVERAIEYEIARQIAAFEAGEKIAQETRGWDENANATKSQRSKEESHDYRYFPDPDLPKLVLSEIPEFKKDTLVAALPELPWTRRARLKALGLKDDDAEMFVGTPALGDFFDAVARALGGDTQATMRAANYIASDVAGQLGDSNQMPGALEFAKLMRMYGEGKVSSRGTKDILKIMMEREGDPATIAEGEGLLQEDNIDTTRAMVERIIEDNPGAVSEYKAGKIASLQFLVGQAMKFSGGRANPQMLRSLLEEILKK